jgi:hypothetical protein
MVLIFRIMDTNGRYTHLDSKLGKINMQVVVINY